MLAYSLQLVAALYASTLSEGTYIAVTDVWNTLVPSVGGVVALQVTVASLLHLWKQPSPMLVTVLGNTNALMSVH